jgi:hypothetical protein
MRGDNIVLGDNIALGYCFCCHSCMSFDPDKVPSIPFLNGKKPICAACVELGNAQRVKNGLEPIIPPPGAYVDCEL